jgi:hypothetical protein
MAALHTELVTGGWHPSCYRPSDPVAHSDHPRGRACDPPPGSYGTLPTATQKAAGEASPQRCKPAPPAPGCIT